LAEQSKEVGCENEENPVEILTAARDKLSFVTDRFTARQVELSPPSTAGLWEILSGIEKDMGRALGLLK
jgi:hypothetical protein